MSDSERGGTATPPLVLDDQICFALYTASQAFGSCYRAALAATGLTYSQYLVMMVLWEHDRDADGGAVSLKLLGERLHLDNGTLSPLVKRLEQRGLVIRTRSRADERLLQIECSPGGRALYGPAVAAQAEVAVATGLPTAELDALRDTLLALSGHLRAAQVPDSEAS